MVKVDRKETLCSYTISDEAPTVTVFADVQQLAGIPECKQDGRSICFYAGTPILFLGYKIGSMCILDYQPRHDFDDRKKFMMLDLAAIISRYLEERQRQSLRSEVTYAQLMVSILQSLKPALTRVMRQKRAMEFVFDILKQQSTPNTIKDYVIDFSDATKEFRSGLNQLSTTIETSLSLGMMSIQLKPSAVRKRSMSFNPHNATENGLIKWLNELYDLHTMPPHYSPLVHDIHWSVRPAAARCLHVTDLSTEACSLIANLLISRNLFSYKTIYVIVDMNHMNNHIDHSDAFSNIRSSKIMLHIVCSDPIKSYHDDDSSHSPSPQLSPSRSQYKTHHHHHHLLTTDEQTQESTMRFIQQCDLFVVRSLLQAHKGGIDHYIKHGPVDEDYPFLEPEIECEWFNIWLPCKSICANNPVVTPLAIVNTSSGSAMSSSSLIQQRSSSSKLLQNVIDIDGMLNDVNWEHQNPPSSLTSLVSSAASTCKKSNIMTKLTQQQLENGKQRTQDNRRLTPSSSQHQTKISVSIPRAPRGLFPFRVGPFHHGKEGSPHRSPKNKYQGTVGHDNHSTSDRHRNHGCEQQLRGKPSRNDGVDNFNPLPHQSMFILAWKHFTESIVHPPWQAARIDPR